MSDSRCTAEVHGTEHAYTHMGCRCPAALRERTARQRIRRKGGNLGLIVPTWPAARRVQALYALGWGWSDLEHLTGKHWNTFRRIAFIERVTIHRDTDALIRSLYDTLAGVPGPSDKARRLAAERDWKPPHYWRNIDARPAHPPDRELARRIAESPRCKSDHVRNPLNTKMMKDSFGKRDKLECLECRRKRDERRRNK